MKLSSPIACRICRTIEAPLTYVMLLNIDPISAGEATVEFVSLETP